MKERIMNGAIWLFLLFVTASSLTGYINSQQRAKRLLFDLKASRDSTRTFTTRDGHEASKLIAQELSAHELKTAFPDVATKLQNLYIAPRRTESYTETGSQMKAEVTANVMDSLPEIPANIRIAAGTDTNTVARDTAKIKLLKYRDEWIQIRGVIDGDSAKIKILASDTIFTAIYRGERRHRWAWIFSRRQLTTVATNRNPYIKIKVISSGVIKK